MSRRLLVTDDAVIIREMIKDAATAAGWTIAGEAGDGIEAVERFRELRPDAVTLDLVMPRRGGIETLREILAIDPTARVVVVSALEQKSILRQAFQIGAADFLIKPFDRRALVQTLDALVPEGAGCQPGLS